MRLRTLLAGIALAMAAPSGAQEEPATAPSLVPEILVIGSSDRLESIDITPGTSASPAPDAMEILTRMPGANVNRNGALSGQAQYRGLFGPRMTVTVNGMLVTPGGPNWMDAPLHYMPAALTETVTMTRGIAPVSAGPGIGGLIQAESRRSEFTAGSGFQFTGDAVLSSMSNNGSAVAGFVGGANSEHRYHFVGSREEGDTIESGDGLIGATAYGRTTYGAGYGANWGNSEFGIDISHTETDLTGTPALPLDIDFFSTDRINALFESRAGDVDVSIRVFRTDVEHGMNNFNLRQPADFSQLPLPPFLGVDRRLVDVVADATGFVAKAARDIGTGQLTAGLDGNSAMHTAVVLDPDFAPFFVNNFNEAQHDQLGVFAEWVGELGSNWSMEIGARYMRVESDAGAVDGFPARLADGNPTAFGPGTPPFAFKVLRDRFNAADRKVTDSNVDAVLKFNYAVSDTLLWDIGIARKTRSPMYVERYLWVPLEVNSGLGDLNNYVGDINLVPEVSHQFELGVDWRFASGFLAPRVFVRQVDDYIQGVASTDMIVNAVSGRANGDPTPLRFANVDARLYGFDAVARHWFSEWLRLDGTVSYVRGQRTDVDDNLYRIAPLNGRISITAERGNWSVTAESVLVAEQDRISATIVADEPRSSNAPTPGYGLLNVYGQWQAGDRVQIRVGIDNVLDRHYLNHIAGFNRVINSDVPIGSRVPGPGMNAFGQLRVRM